MILEMKVPSPGESISEVEIAEWLVSDGDYVEKDQAIAEVACGVVAGTSSCGAASTLTGAAFVSCPSGLVAAVSI